MTRDEYDPRVCFDDIYGVDPFYGVVTGAVPHGDPIHAARAIIHRARRRRLHSPTIVGDCDVDTTYSFVVGSLYEVLGDDAPPIDLPVYGELYKQFSEALPEPRVARIDDETSYAAFRAARGEKYLDSFAQRLSALEDAVAQHVADNHGAGRVAALEDALRQHIMECRCGGTSIPLPGVSNDLVQSWQDGGEILCTVRFSGPDGQMKMLTSGTPAERAVNEVVGCAIEEGVEPDELVQVAAPVAQVLGASCLAQQLLGVVQDVIDCSVGDAVTLTSATDPALAAAMMLIQRCQAGDWTALQDARRMSRDKSSKKLMKDAANLLARAQAMKAGMV